MKQQDMDGAPIDRWVERADEGSPEARAGALLQQAIRREPPSADRLAAIGRRLRADRRRPRRHWALRLAIALALLFSGGALTAAAQRYLHIIAPTSPAPPPQAPAPDAQRATHHRAALAAPAPPLAPLAETVAAPAGTAAPRASRSAAESGGTRSALGAPLVPAGLTPPPLAAPEPSASALAQESALLADALRKLRQDDDARAALAILDGYDARFGTGALAPEAALARIEALIKLRRNVDALALLERTAPAPRGTGRDLLIARAELRAAAGRCGVAVPDFDLLLAGNPAFDVNTERALWGRASCRAAADAKGARLDLQDYLARFPEGRFAAGARAALGQ